MQIQLAVGEQNQPEGSQWGVLRGGRQGDQIVSELHGRFYEQAWRGRLFSNGTTGLTALSANTISLTATTTPILGVYNPPASGVNAVVLQATLAMGANNAATVGAGIFVWATSIGNNGISTGTTPTPRLMNGAASKCKGLAGVALTGLTNNLVVAHAAGFSTPTIITTSGMSAAITTPTVSQVENLDGSFVIPPGGVLALLNTVSTTTVSGHGFMLWEEVPV